MTDSTLVYVVVMAVVVLILMLVFAVGHLSYRLGVSHEKRRSNRHLAWQREEFEAEVALLKKAWRHDIETAVNPAYRKIQEVVKRNNLK